MRLRQANAQMTPHAQVAPKAQVILINGISGAGKTSLARQLAPLVGFPLFSKDDFKEAFFDFGPPGIEPAHLGMLAMEALWSAAAAVPFSIVESHFHRQRDLEFAQAGLKRARLTPVLEIYCRLEVAQARDRTIARKAAGERHRMHSEYSFSAAQWAFMAQGAEPLGLSPVLEVDTAQHLDPARLSAEVSRLISVQIISAQAQ